MKRTFYVKPLWDSEAKVWYAESDISGLGIEAPNLDAFEEVMNEHAVELILANHVSIEELASTPLCDLVPAIIYHRPLDQQAA